MTAAEGIAHSSPRPALLPTAPLTYLPPSHPRPLFIISPSVSSVASGSVPPPSLFGDVYATLHALAKQLNVRTACVMMHECAPLGCRGWPQVTDLLILPIAEGHGTATDAAKLLRDVPGGAEALQNYGISLRGKVASDGAVLANSKGELSDAIQQSAAELFQRPGQRGKILEQLKNRAVEILERENGVGAEQPASASLAGEPAREAAGESADNWFGGNRPAKFREGGGIDWGDDSGSGSNDDDLFARNAGERSGPSRGTASIGFTRSAAGGLRATGTARQPGRSGVSRRLVEAFARSFNAAVERYAKPGAGQLGLRWDESAHPREEDGTFAAKDGASAKPAAEIADEPFSLSAPKPKAKPAEFANFNATQLAIWHGINDLAGQKKLFSGMDLGRAKNHTSA